MSDPNSSRVTPSPAANPPYDASRTRIDDVEHVQYGVGSQTRRPGSGLTSRVHTLALAALLFAVPATAQDIPVVDPGPATPDSAVAVPAPAPQPAAVPATPTGVQVTADTTDPLAIMKAVEAKPRANRTKTRTVLRIIDRSGRTRERTVRAWAMDVGGAQRQLMVFDHPADVRGTALLSIDYEDAGRDDDQWLFLPSLKKTTRISSGDRSGSFMGTDLTYSDMTRPDASQYEYKMLKQSVTVGGEDCWLIESRPKTAKAKEETGYVKTNTWFSKSKMLMLQVKAWVREGRRLKYIKFGDIKKLAGHWTPQKISARTVRGRSVESTTVIQFGDMTADNADVDKKLFDQNTQWWLR